MDTLTTRPSDQAAGAILSPAVDLHWLQVFRQQHCCHRQQHAWPLAALVHKALVNSSPPSNQQNAGLHYARTSTKKPGGSCTPNCGVLSC